MRKLVRTPAPDVLVERGPRWAQAFCERRSRDPAAVFRWATHEGRPVNQLLIEPLRRLTDAHCSYCDGYPVSTTSPETIDHFRPKSTFCALSYSWDNLFYACGSCQGAKGEQFDDDLLKPDDVEYEFDRYLQVNYRTGRLEPSATSSSADQARAAVTIQTFALNRADRCEARLRAVRAFQRVEAAERGAELDLHPYRFMFRDL